ncbi:MAG: hypothetical protein COA73_10425 [Candidatus Hydrogenedentota bacterium]|nr:MAG: hypothetical protein COA73_10425 [Candidatus Hydrogenedentota bacterium]
MIAQELLDLLVCPENKTSVAVADDTLVEKINASIKAGEVKNRGGETVDDKIDGGLVREDKAYLYPVRDDIPIMLIDEAIPLDAFK